MTKQHIDKQNQGIANPSPLERLGEVVAWALLFIFFILCFTSCDIDGEREVCEYNTRITFGYNRENTSPTSVLPPYIKTIDQYIFDEQDILVMINRLPGTSCYGQYVSETNLPPGKYTVVAWGNDAAPSHLNRQQIGTTTKQEMMLYLDNAYTAARSTIALQSNAERLYYGYRTFTITEYGVSRVNVDMTHAHCVLNVTVKWKNAAQAPANTGDFHLMLRDIAPQQGFMPQYTFRGNTLMNYTPSVDTYQHSPTTIRHNIPVVDMQSPLLDHRTAAYMSYEQVLNGEFVTYRYCDEGHQLLSVWSGDTQLMKEVDLQKFFQESGIELDTNLRQEFEIEIVIDGDKVSIMLMTVDDWEDGGVL